MPAPNCTRLWTLNSSDAWRLPSDSIASKVWLGITQLVVVSTWPIYWLHLQREKCVMAQEMIPWDRVLPKMPSSTESPSYALQLAALVSSRETTPDLIVSLFLIALIYGPPIKATGGIETFVLRIGVVAIWTGTGSGPLLWNAVNFDFPKLEVGRTMGFLGLLYHLTRSAAAAAAAQLCQIILSNDWHIQHLGYSIVIPNMRPCG